VPKQVLGEVPGIVRYPMWIFVAKCSLCPLAHELEWLEENNFIVASPDCLPYNAEYCKECLVFHQPGGKDDNALGIWNLAEGVPTMDKRDDDPMLLSDPS
jgi:hypothetical protein